MRRGIALLVSLGLCACLGSDDDDGAGVAVAGGTGAMDGADGAAGTDAPSRFTPFGRPDGPADAVDPDAPSEDPEGGTPQPSPAVPSACVDDDGDGFGDGCAAGNDCDDDDAAITDQCERCDSPDEGCPCEDGTRPQFCDPPDQRVPGGTLVSSEGTRYCRGGLWGPCEVLIEYATLIPDQGTACEGDVVVPTSLAGLECGFALPQGAASMPDAIGVTVNGTVLPRLESLSECDTSLGWVLDDPVAPTAVVLCPALCEAPLAVALVLGCAT